MAWSEIQKSINSVLEVPLNVHINNLIGTSTATNDTTVFGKLNEKVRPYKQLKLTSTKSPICTWQQQPKGVMVNYNSQYYLIASSTTLWKIRWSDHVIVGSIAANGISSFPIVINDFAFTLIANVNMLYVIDLTSMTAKYFLAPTTSTGAITVLNTKNQHFDIRHVSGTQYQVLVWVDGATADGIIVCALDTTATNASTMAQVSFWGTVPPTATTACTFGTDGDANYYAINTTTDTIDSRVIASGNNVFSMIILDLDLLDYNSFRSCQTADYLIAQVRPATGNGLSDVIMFKKSDATYNFCGISCDKTITLFTPCQIKRTDYCVFSTPQSVVTIKNDKTINQILKPQDELFNGYMIQQTYLANSNGVRYEGVLNYDIPNNKITLSGACFFDATTLANTNTFAIREYSIV